MTPDLTLWKQYTDAVEKENEKLNDDLEKMNEEMRLNHLIALENNPRLRYVPCPRAYGFPHQISYEDFLTWQVNGKQFKEEK